MICKSFNITAASSVRHKVGRGEMDHGKRQITKGLVHHVKELGLDVQLNKKDWRVLGRRMRQSDLCLGKSVVAVWRMN